MPLMMLQISGFCAGFATTVYAGYTLLLDPMLVARYRHLALLEEAERQLFVDESRMTAQLNELEQLTSTALAAAGKSKTE